MTNKKDLAQLAFVALLAASTLPVDGQAGQLSGTQETYLAALGGCGSKCGAVADNAPNSDSYNPNRNSYQTSSNGYSNKSNSYTTDANRMNKDWNASRNTNDSYNTNRAYNDKYSNAGQSATNQPFNDTYRTSSYEVDAYPSNTDSSAGASAGRYMTSSGYNRTADSTYVLLSESQLFALLNAEARAIYMSLDAEGKALALQLASQNSYNDKNTAVKDAQKKVNEKRGMMSR